MLWKALATNYHVARGVIILLYIKLRLRPCSSLSEFNCHTHLVSLMVSSTCTMPLAWFPPWQQPYPRPRWAPREALCCLQGTHFQAFSGFVVICGGGQCISSAPHESPTLHAWPH